MVLPSDVYLEMLAAQECILHPTSRLEVFHCLVLFCFIFFHKAKKAKDEQKKHEIF